MKNLILLVCCVCSILFIGCNNDQKQKANDKLAKLNPSGIETSNSCLMEYATKYDELLSVSDAASILGLDAANAETEYSKTMDDPTFQSLTYKWESDRKRKVEFNGMKVEVPVDNYIKISGMKPFTPQLFTRDFGKKTEAEIEEISKNFDKAFDKALDQTSESKEANEAAKSIEKTGTSKADAKAVVGNMKESGFVKILRAYENLNGIGDDASWNPIDKSLHVLKSGITFYIEADLDENQQINKQKAIEAAKIVLAKCN